MVVGIGEALIAANLLGISAIASMWKDPNAVRTAVTAKPSEVKLQNALPPLEYQKQLKLQTATEDVSRLFKVLEDAQKELKHKNAAVATVKKQLKDTQTLFPNATDQIATLTKQVSQAESDAAAAFLAVGTARAAYDQALEDLNALTPPVVTKPPRPGAGSGAGAGLVLGGPGGAGAGAGLVLGSGGSAGSGSAGGAGAGTGLVLGSGGSAGSVGSGSSRSLGSFDSSRSLGSFDSSRSLDSVGSGASAGAGTGLVLPPPGGAGAGAGTGLVLGSGGSAGAGAGAGLVLPPPDAGLVLGGPGGAGGSAGLRDVLADEAERRRKEEAEAEFRRVEGLVHTLHPNAIVSEDGGGNPQVLVPLEGGGSEAWKVVVSGDTVKFQKQGTTDQVDRIPRLDELAAAAAAAAMAAEAAAEEDARLRVEAEAEAAAAAEAARVAAEAQVAEEARLQAEAAAAEQARLQAEAAAAEQARLQAESEAAAKAESEAAAKAAAEAAASARFPTVGTPYLNQNGHPNTGFVVRYLQSPDQATSRADLRTDFATWFGTEDDLLKPLKQNFKDWNDGTRTKYADTPAGWSIKFMQAIDRASKVNLDEPTVERAIENVQEAPTETEGEALGEGGYTSASGGEGLSAPQTPPRRGVSGATGVQETPNAGQGLDGHFDAPTPESSPAPSSISSPASPPASQDRRPTLEELLQRGKEITAEQAALSSGDDAARRQAANEIADRTLAGVTAARLQRESQSSNNDAASSILARKSQLQRDIESTPDPATRRKGGRRGKGRKSTFRKKRKNKK